MQEIYPGNKRKHFDRIHKQTSIPFSDMVCPCRWREEYLEDAIIPPLSQFCYNEGI